MIKNNKIPVSQKISMNDILSTKQYNNKFLIALSIKDENHVSQYDLKINIHKCLIKLKEFLENKNLKEFSIAKSEDIEKLSWVDVLKLIK